VDNQFSVPRQLTDLASLASHIISFCEMMLVQERRKDRHGIPTRNEDGSAQAEFHHAPGAPFITDATQPGEYGSYAPRTWPKEFKLF